MSSFILKQIFLYFRSLCVLGPTIFYRFQKNILFSTQLNFERMLPALLPGQQGNKGRSQDWDWTMDRTAPPWTEQSRLSGAVQGSVGAQ
jgi:hypothetical protein